MVISGEETKDEWNFLRALPEGQDRTIVLTGFLRQVLKHHREELPALWNEMPENLRRELVARGFPDVAPGTSALDGLADLQREHIEATRDPTAMRAWMDTGAREWARRDPAAAVAWAQQHLKGEQRVEATSQLFVSAAAGSFESAAQLWHSLPDGILRARVAGNLAAGAPAERWAEVDALLAMLSPADRRIADASRQSASQALQRQVSTMRIQNAIWEIQQGQAREDR